LNATELLKHEQVINALNWTQSYIPAAICSLGILLNGAFLAFVYSGLRRKALSSKMYLFLMNKAIGDLIASASICVLTVLGLTNSIDAAVSVALIGVAVISYFAASLTYLALSLTKLLAIKDPLLYRRKISSSLITKVLIGTWPLGVLLTLIGGEIDWVPIFNRKATCEQRYRSTFAFVSAAIFELFFISVVVSCSFVLYLVYKHENQPRRGPTGNNYSSSDVPPSGKSFHKLLAGLLVYALCYFLALIKPFYMTDVCQSFNVARCNVDGARGLVHSSYIITQYNVLSLSIFFRLLIVGLTFVCE
jgi:hypothetical protein